MSKNFSVPMSAPKPGFGDDVVAELERDPVGEDRAVAVGDVGERAGVDEGRLSFEGLHDRRVKRFLHEHRDRAGHAEIFERDRIAGLAASHHHPRTPLTEVPKRLGIVRSIDQCQDRHELGRRR